MSERIDAFRFGPVSRALFGVYHHVDAPRAAVLLCPPLLHEHVRSHRLFAGLASLLAADGLCCLRFDYHGTGDADGDSTAFDPARVGEDLAHAAEALRSRSDGAPLIVLAVRASALFARAHAAELYASAVWLWQPVLDAAGYLHQLEMLDAGERSSGKRYPFARPGPVREAGELAGFATNAGFRDALRAYDGHDWPDGVPVAWLDDADALQRATTAVDAQVVLPTSITGWAGQVELEGLLPARDAREAVDVLLSDLEAWA
ncbi:hypothetical protein E2F46_01105 [Luteimonas aestuarii]|uniref:Serine aminopeptidase S33 domain-containing protein n=1 Tax=Luteimonas aestuarii TaxID=453837 RepID=A0A4R5U482_9GAMM|nr:hypothetical protein [Luteimonas aestuarii]TDK28518.1 hypothetical protein E2F46_01105 [Luteimonas aestuarii]